MRSTITSFVLSLMCVYVYAQDVPLQGFNGQVIPPSPDAAAFAKYGEVPVNLNSGIPRIEIPLYQIQTGDITVPITLSYHAGGIRVGELSGWTGLGWTINSGGGITRTVRGGADEQYGFFSMMEQLLDFHEDGILEYAGLNTPFQGDDPTPGFERYDELKDFFYWQLMVNGYDTEPDLFYYSTPAGSGKFVFSPDENAPVRTIPYTRNIIEPTMFASSSPTSGEITAFRMTDMNGIVHNFTERETTRLSSSNLYTTERSDPFNSAWHLTGINSPASKRNVSFSYKDASVTHKLVHSQTIREKFDFEQECGDDGVITNTTSITTNEVKYLDRITWNEGRIEFLSTTGREDLTGAHKLDRIDIYNVDNRLIKSYVFEYDYFYNSDAVLGEGITTEQDRKQLKLISVQEVAPSGETLPAHEFFYDGNPAPRTSKDQDHWGFYNAANNTTLVPEFLDWNGATRAGGDREPNFQYAKRGILERINYPTGGYTTFGYEPHDYFSTEFTYTPRSLSFNAGDSEPFDNGDGTFDICLRPQDCQPFVSEEFTTGSTVSSPSIEIKISKPADIAAEAIETSATLINLDNGTRYDFFANDDGDTFTVGSRFRLIKNTNYRIELRSTVQTSKVRAIIRWNERQTNYTNKKVTGGIRIKQIDSYESLGATPLTKRYSYTQSLNEARSSGKHIGFVRPNYVTEERRNFCTPCGDSSSKISCSCFYECVTYVRHGSNLAYLGTSQGSHIVYDEVKEIFGNSPNNGWKRYQFAFVKDGNRTLVENPPYNQQLTDMDWRRGQLEKEQYFNRNGRLVKEVENVYAHVDNNDFGAMYDQTYRSYPGFKFALDINNMGVGTLAQYGTSYNYGFYENISAFTYLAETKTTTYNTDSPSDFVEEYREFIHDNPSHLQLTRSVLHTSEAGALTTDYRYPSDVSPSGLLVSENILTPVLEQYSYDENNLMIGSSKTNYSGLLPNTIQQGSFSEATTLSSYLTNRNSYLEQVMDYDFNSDSNIIKMTERSGKTTNVSWSYPHSIPTSVNVDGFITQYNYVPLIGITSQTDPNGRVTTYEYDAFNRLIIVKDNENNIVQKNEYNYAND